jgi:hypothetical protein
VFQLRPLQPPIHFLTWITLGIGLLFSMGFILILFGSENGDTLFLVGWIILLVCFILLALFYLYTNRFRYTFQLMGLIFGFALVFRILFFIIHPTPISWTNLPIDALHPFSKTSFPLAPTPYAYRLIMETILQWGIAPLFYLLSEAVLVGLVYLVMNQFHRKSVVLVFYLWNPLILLYYNYFGAYFIGLIPLVMGLYLLQRDQKWLAAIFLGIAGWFSYPEMVLVLLLINKLRWTILTTLVIMGLPFLCPIHQDEWITYLVQSKWVQDFFYQIYTIDFLSWNTFTRYLAWLAVVAAGILTLSTTRLSIIHLWMIGIGFLLISLAAPLPYSLIILLLILSLFRFLIPFCIFSMSIPLIHLLFLQGEPLSVGLFQGLLLCVLVLGIAGLLIQRFIHINTQRHRIY